MSTTFILFYAYNIMNRIGGVIDSVLASMAVDCGQSKKLSTWYLLLLRYALRSKSRLVGSES